MAGVPRRQDFGLIPADERLYRVPAVASRVGLPEAEPSGGISRT
jgi:hypothetical protein